MKVDLNDFSRQWDVIQYDALAAARRVGASGWYVLGPEVRRFEAALAKTWSIEHAVGVGSGLDALEIGLRCLGIVAGDSILTTPLSAFATTLAIVRVGATPIFVDTGATGLIDLERCREVLSQRPVIRCILPVHLYGHALDLAALRSLQDKFDLLILEDCAQSIAAESAGIPTGSVGQVAATSLYPTKNLGALGDGGAVLTAFSGIAEKARALRHYGQTGSYLHDYVGLNSRLDEFHAAIMTDAILPHLYEWTEARRSVAAQLRGGIRNPYVEIPPEPTGSRSVYHLFPVLVPPTRRQSFQEHLKRQGVMTGIHYPKLIPEQRAMTKYGRFEVIGDLRWARRFAEGEVSLPVHPLLKPAEVERIIDACNSWNID